MEILLTLPLLEERAFLEFSECLSQLLLRIHHDGTVPRDGLFERLSRDQKESDSIVPGLYGDFVATVKKYERSIICFHGRSSVQPFDRLGRNRERTRGIAKFSAACKNIGEGMPSHLHRKSLSLAWRNPYVWIDRIGSDPVHWASLPPEIAADHSHVSAVVIRDLR